MKQESSDDSNIDLAEFNGTISDKLDIVDPLDRRIPQSGDTENQAVKLKDLKEELKQMASIPSNHLEAPFPASLKSQIDSLF